MLKLMSKAPNLSNEYY